MSRNVLPPVICVTKLLEIVGNLLYVLGEPTQKKMSFQQQLTAKTSRNKSNKKIKHETKPTSSRKVQQNKLTLESMPPQYSKHYQVPFGNDANCVNHPGAEDIKIHPKSPNFLIEMRFFCNFSFVSLGIRTRSRRCMERTRQVKGRWSRPQNAALERS